MRGETRVRLAGAMVTAALVALVVATAGLAGAAIGNGEHAVQIATVAGPCAVVALFGPVSRTVRRLTGADRDASAPLAEVARSLASVADIDDALAIPVDAIATQTGAATVAVWSHTETSSRVLAFAPPDAVVIDGDGIMAPIVAHEVVLGVLQVVPGPTTVVGRELVQALANQVAPAMRNLALRRELEDRADARRQAAAALRAARRRIVELGDDERSMLERDLHDGAQQCLMALVLRLGLAARTPTRVTPSPRDLLALVADARRELEGLATGFAADRLAGDGLVAALVAMGTTGGIEVRVDASRLPALPADVGRGVYFTCVEALQNARKHAGVDVVSVVLRASRDRLAFEVVDEGVGFDVDATPMGFGLRSMTGRVVALGGDLTIESSVGKGTRVRGWLPIASEVSA